jgi:chromate reductase, NAD(P)H dehydrogenase (quinone)
LIETLSKYSIINHEIQYLPYFPSQTIFVNLSRRERIEGGSDMEKKIKILGFAGSLRKGSYNKSILSTALEMVSVNSILEIFDLEGIPPFNQDLENQPPERVKEFKTKIRSADAILIATPEYNYSIPGVLKNAIDWASRPFGDNAFEGKPVALMGASPGMLGTARSQYHLRQTFIFLNMYPLNRPEVMVPFANEKIDPNGKVTDEKTKKKIGELLESLVVWTKNLKKD